MAGLKRTLRLGLLIGGLALCLAPTIWSRFSYHLAADQIQLIRKQAETLDDHQIDEVLAKAQAWNENLAGHVRSSEMDVFDLADTGQSFEVVNQPEFESLPAYDKQLCVLDHGVMGILHVPKIGITLPIYHGVEEEALSKGAGHLPSSSLPVGSPTGRVVLSAHRGLMSSELFTRLDEMEIGDLFQIENPKQTMAYQVCDIEVILPEEVEKLAIVEGEDLVTLLTCTPYGINDHRLLVTGRRVEWTEQVQEEIREPVIQKPSLREQLFKIWPWLMVDLVSVVLFVSFLSTKRKAKRK